jgi:WD40 repeat protein
VGEPLENASAVLSIAYSPDGRRIVSGSSDNTVRIWDVESGEAVGEPLRGHTGSLRSVAYSPDNQHVVSGSDDATIRIWDAGIELENGEYSI